MGSARRVAICEAGSTPGSGSSFWHTGCMAAHNTVIAEHGVQKPGDEATHDAAGAPVRYTIEIVLGGTTANVQTDWATLIALDLACPSSVMSWQKS